MDVTQTLKDTAYVAVGFGVIGFQRAQVARHDLTKAISADQGRLSAQVLAHVGDVAHALETQITEVQEHLPVQVKEAFTSACQVAEAAAAQVRSRLPR